MSQYNPCFLIPCYNHGSTIANVVASLSEFELPFIIIDDGSDSKTKRALSELSSHDNITLVTLSENQGKGGAVMAGMYQAQKLYFSHVIQIDADGQHDVQALPALLESSKTNPLHLISGKPIYDESIPKARLYGRYATHIWVWIETLSFSIKDSMCGLRAYPVSSTISVLDKYSVGKRMDFDIEILVRMYWEGVVIEFVETRVIYPEGGVSHFDALWDNLKISWMHTRLFFGMLPRVPKLLARNRKIGIKKENRHWSKKKEQGTIIGIKLMLAIYSLFGRKVFNLLLKPVIRYYHLKGSDAKQASETYLNRLRHFANRQGISLPEKIDSYHHLLSFGQTMLDKLAAWKGDFNVNNLTIHGQNLVQRQIDTKQGAVIVGSHLGNIELCRALSRRHTNVKINALVFTEHAERFNSVMKAVNPSSELNLIQVNSMGPETAIVLQQKIEQGEWIVIVGDRTSTSKESRAVWADFLGHPAPFPQGPFMLASILKAPVYLLFGLRDDSSEVPHFNVHFEHFSDKIELPREERQQALNQIVQRYAQRLEHYCFQAPLQWYNFFNFWILSNQQDDDSKQQHN